jgi:FkbM family methyltransferase
MLVGRRIKQLNRAIWHDSNPYLFSLLFNLRNRVRGVNAFIHLNKLDTSFSITCGEKLRYVTSTSRALLYIDGFEKRASDLYSKYMLNLVDLPKQAVVVDCGANMGDFRLALNLKGSDVKYYGFEPSPRDYMMLMKNSSSPDTNLNIALHHEDCDEITFYIDSKTASSSVIRPKFVQEIVTVPAQKLSSLFTNTQINLLKLEAEGSEPEVLQGCLEILENIHFISADVGAERGEAEDDTRDEVISFLVSHGFEIISENQPKSTILFRNPKFRNYTL